MPAARVKSAYFVGLYCGGYDSLYDFRPGPRLEGYPYKGRFREVYTDVALTKMPFTLRLGCQMVV